MESKDIWEINCPGLDDWIWREQGSEDSDDFKVSNLTL